MTRNTTHTTSPRQRLSGPVPPDTWDLSHLLAHPSKEFEELTKDLDADVRRFESWRTRLGPDLLAEDFRELMTLNEEITRASARLNAYAYLWFSENTADVKARAFKSKVEERMTSFNNRMLFFDLWWQALDASNAERLLSASDDWRYHLETIRRFKDHTLSEAEEKVVNLKNVTGRSAINTLYDVITNGFQFSLTVNGKRRILSREELSAFVRDPRGRVREAAYRELLRVFSQHQDTLGEIYTTLVNDWKSENLGLRKFGTPITVRNLGNDIPDRAVASLLEVCTKNVGVFQEYFRVKARICRIPSMSRYHLYAPHHADRKRFRYADAVRMVLDAYREFSPRLADLAERVFAERHVDARMRPGKLSGAYCYSVLPGQTPYVLLNFTGEAREVATLAHELGHAVHGLMAAEHSAFTFQATLPLAETASVFGERMLSDALMARERSRSVKQGLLIGQLDDIYATVLRQAYFVLFEQTAHEMVAHGATAQDLAAAYLESLSTQFGKAVAIPEEFKWEWLTIPHIYGSPFYCYAYSFGNLLVLALYQRYKQMGRAFVPKYLEMLAGGGSMSPAQILTQVEVDMNAESFWQSGFDTVRDMVSELERTAE